MANSTERRGKNIDHVIQGTYNNHGKQHTEITPSHFVVRDLKKNDNNNVPCEVDTRSTARKLRPYLPRIKSQFRVQ